MFQFITDMLKDLLPSREQSNATWVSRLFVLFLLGSIGVSFFWNAILTTTLGERYGIKRLNDKLPFMTHMELLITRRQVWQQLSGLRINDDDIRAVFLLMMIDKKTRNIVLKDMNPSETDIVIWEFEIPVRRFSSLEVIEDILNNQQVSLEKKIRETEKCITIPLEGETLTILKRAMPDFLSTHAAICPMYTFYNPRMIGSTMIFFRIRPPLEAWHYEEKLRQTTIQVSSFYRDMTIHYEIIYE